MHRLVLPVFAAIVALIPLVPGVSVFWITLLDNIGLASLVVMGLVLLTGVGGMTSFGQAAFCGFAAYTTAVMTAKFGWSPWASLPVALVVTGLAAVVLGLVTVRLSGHFLPLGTIAWGIALYYAFGKLEILGRHDGISGIPPLSLFGWSLVDPRAAYYVIWGAVLGAAVLTMNLLDSRTGRAIRALRGGRVAAEAFGIEPARMKLAVFVYAALLAGLSGWLYAHVQRAVNPTPFGVHPGIEYLFMAVAGGAGQVWGAIVGAGLVTFLKDALQRVVPALFGTSAQYETIVFGLLLVVILQVAKDGLWPRIAALFPPPPPAPVDSAAEPLPARPRATAEPLLEVSGARKTFGGLVAVNDVSLRVKRGEIVALIGPNGAGKSTTFNLITGVLPASGGTISVAGERIDGARPQAIAARGVARTFQHVKLLPEMSVLDNVAIGAHLRGRAGFLSGLLRLDRPEERRMLAEAARQIARVGLAEHMHKPAGSLALGQQRIVEIARALCLAPDLLLLDEPAAGLRHFEKAALADLLRQLRAEGVAVLLVEHDMGFVMSLTDHVVVLDFGTRIAEGPPAEIKRNPAVLAAYLGAEA
jgi:branched-chain amino acid transport system permease protein